MQTKRPNILHHLSIYPQTICFTKIISRQRDTQRWWGLRGGVGGDYMSLFLDSCHCTANGTNHLWSCCKHTIQIWVICIYVFVCDYSVATVHADGHSRLHPPSLYAWKADSYMWYFALGGALHDHWPIYWHTQEAPRCHGTKSSRCRKEGERQLAKVLILTTAEILAQSYWVSAVRQILVLLFKKVGMSLRDLIEL